MLNENIREKCIYNLVDEYDDEDRHIFFNYLYNVRFSCLELEGKITSQCAHRVIQNLGIDADMVHKCKDNQFTNNGWHINTLLEEDREKSDEYGVSLTPAMFINKFPYQGKWEGQSIFNAICQGFKIDKLPAVCDPGHDI